MCEYVHMYDYHRVRAAQADLLITRVARNTTNMRAYYIATVRRLKSSVL